MHSFKAWPESMWCDKPSFDTYCKSLAKTIPVLTSRKSQVASRKSQVASRKSQVASRKHDDEI